MKFKKIISVVIALAMIMTKFVIPASAASIYTVENGWNLPSSDGYQAKELEDGRLQMNHEVTFTPTLEANKKYSIKFDVTGLETGSDWTYQFRLALISGSETLDGALSYRQAGVWENGKESKWLASAKDSTIEVIIDRKTGKYEMYARDVLSASGTFTDTSNFTLKMYKWGGNAPYISNVTVEDITGVYYKQDFEDVGDDFDSWKTASGYTVTVKQPMQIWSGSFGAYAGDNNVLSGAMDIYPLAVTPRTEKYEMSFDIKPYASTFAGGSNWEGIVMQWSLGSSNSDSWHDMKLGTSAGANQTGEINIDKFWLFGQEMTIDPTEWINIKAIYDCTAGTITATATQGTTSVTGTAGFTNTTSSLTGSPKVTFEKITVNSVAYQGVYLDNVVIRDYIEVPENIIYTEANGWTVNSAVEQEDGSLKLDVNQETAALFKPTLEADKKYSIKFDVTGLETDEANPWYYQFRLALISGGTTLDGSLSYRQAGIWENGNETKWVASGTDGEIEVIIDKETGEYEMYALGALSARGIFADTSDFTLKFYKWSGNAPYISNVTVEEIRKNVVYTVANGWTVNEAVEQEDGTLQINNAHDTAAIFRPALEADKKYSIKYDVTGLEVDAANEWTYQFLVDLMTATEEASTAIAYRQATGGRWNVVSTDALVATGTTGTNEIIIDMKTGEWQTYALGNLAQSGTFTDTSDFAIHFYKWGGNAPYISNVTVEEIDDSFTGVYYEQDFEGIQTDFDSWKTANAYTVTDKQPMQIWNGSKVSAADKNYILSGAMDIYPMAVTPRTGKYEMSFDIKPNASTFANGSNWEAIVMQWSLGSSNSDSWHDMKLGTSAGANQTGEINIDKFWLFGQEMVIDPNEWINVKVIYDCAEETITATATQGDVSVTGTAGFTNTTSSVTGSPKVIFEAQTVNEVKYEGVYLDNVVISAKGEDNAPVLSADNIKLYADDVEQTASKAGAFTNTIKVTFGQEMWPDDMTDEKIYVVDKNGNKVQGEINYEYANGVFTIVYKDGFTAGETYTVKVDVVRNIGGIVTLQAYEKSFKVVDGIFAELVSITQGGEVITELSELSAGAAKINVNYSNSTDDTPVLHLITAYYKGGALVLAEYFDKTPDENTKTINYELDYVVKTVDGGYDEVQFMIWDGFDSLKPLSAPISLE